MNRLPILLFLIVTLVSFTPAYAQKPLTKPEKHTQPQTPSIKSSATTKKSNSKTTTNNNSRPSSKNVTMHYINGHEYVDLGLSVKWATCNVGASFPSEYGNYYAWGETSPKSSYTGENSVTYGKNLSSIAGNPSYDAARANWGSTWRLPTNDEIDELVNKCSWVWTTYGEHEGYKVIGPNGNSIFLPAAGWRDGTSLDFTGTYSYYWSATIYANDNNQAYRLGFSEWYFARNSYNRYYGQSIRPVTE